MIKPRTRLVIVLAALVLAVGVAWFFWPRHAEGTLLCLKMVRQTVQQGRPVVFFRVEVADSRRIIISDVERVIPVEEDRPAGRSDSALEIFRTEGSPFGDDQSKPSKDFWEPMHQWPMWDPAKSRKEFGVLAPKTAAVWKLQITAKMEAPLTDRLRWRWGQWNMLWRSGKPISKIISEMFLPFHGVAERRLVESDLITNSVPTR